MSQRSLSYLDLRNAILFGALVYLAIRFIGQIADVLLIFSVTALVVVSLDPIVSWSAQHKVPRAVTTALLALLTIGMFGLLMYFIVPLFIKQVSDLVKTVPTLADKFQHWVDRYPTLRSIIPSEFNLSSVGQYTRPLLGGVTTVTESFVASAGAALIIFVSSIYALNNPGQLVEGFLREARPQYREQTRTAGARLASQVRAWSLGLIIAMLSIFLLTWIALYFLGFRQAFLFAVIAGITEAIPIVGPILGGILPTIVALTQNPVLALWVVGVFIAIQQFENHVLIPQVMSRSLSLHPVTVIFWVLVMGGLFGIIGVFLATPAAVTAGVIHDEVYLRETEQRPQDSATLQKLEEEDQ